MLLLFNTVCSWNSKVFHSTIFLWFLFYMGSKTLILQSKISKFFECLKKLEKNQNLPPFYLLKKLLLKDFNKIVVYFYLLSYDLFSFLGVFSTVSSWDSAKLIFYWYILLLLLMVIQIQKLWHSMYICYRHNMLHYLTYIWRFKNSKENKSGNCSILIQNPEIRKNPEIFHPCLHHEYPPYSLSLVNWIIEIFHYE